MSETAILTDDDGQPLGVLDMDRLHRDGRQLAYALAAAAGDQAQVEALSTAALTAWGPRAVGYVYAEALGVLVDDVVSGLLDLADGLGVPARERLAGLAEPAPEVDR